MNGLWTARRSGRVRHVEDARTDFEVDYARVVHSGSFRRLQGKTQILSLGDDDFYRTRLTHSMEVAQVAEGIAQQLRAGGDERVRALVPAPSLIQAIGLSHDIGHPPFGHGGELALNYCMRDEGGFEGNAQTLRILSRLESFSDADGADLTRRTLLGVLKYPVVRAAVLGGGPAPSLAAATSTISVLDRRTCKPPKSCYDADAPVIDWILEPLADADRARLQEVEQRAGGHARTLRKSLDCSIMDVADDVAYGVHDLEDAIALGFIDEDGFRQAIGTDVCAPLLHALARRPLTPGGAGSHDEFVDRLFGSPTARKAVIGRLVHFFIRAVDLRCDDGFDEPLVAWGAGLSQPAAALLKAFQDLIVGMVIDHPRVQHLEFKGQRMVIAVFEALMTDPRRLLPADVWRGFEQSGLSRRVVCDFVSSFTDGALLRNYERLFSPGAGSVLDRV